MRLFWKFLKEVRRILFYRILRLKTNGVRIVIRDTNRVFLIKHPYDDYWVFPGGGIKKGETSIDAAIREAQEEAGIDLLDEFKILGTYNNNKRGKRDTITLVICDSWRDSSAKKRIIDKIEVQRSGWFNLDDLPYISKATSRRLSEIEKGEYSDVIRLW